MAEMNFLEYIRETEQQAEDIVNRARDDARLRQDEARLAAADRISGTREEAIDLQRKILADAESEAARIIDLNADQSRQAAGVMAARAAGRLDAAATAVMGRIVDSDVYR